MQIFIGTDFISLVKLNISGSTKERGRANKTNPLH